MAAPPRKEGVMFTDQDICTFKQNVFYMARPTLRI